MKKRILATVLGLALLIVAGAAAFAENNPAEWNVKFTKDKKLTSNYTYSAAAKEIFDMQPGDQVDLTVTLTNDDWDASNWYLTNKVLETLEAAKAEATGGGYTYDLTFSSPNSRDPLVLYTSERVGGEEVGVPATQADGTLTADRVGLAQATQGLEDWLYLDTLQPGQRAYVRLRVSLDGESQGNVYQDTLAQLQLKFAVDPITEFTETRTERQIVRTGDKYSTLPFIIAAGVSGLLLLVFGLMGLFENKKLKKAAQKLACFALVGAVLLTMPALSLTAFAAEGGEDEPGQTETEEPPAGEETPAAPETGSLTQTVAATSNTYKVRLYVGNLVEAAVGETVTLKVSDKFDTWENTLLGPVTIDENTAVIEAEVPCGRYLKVEGSWDDVTVSKDGNDTKYYIKGVRESGEDNTDVDENVFQVNQDTDLVIAYGIKGQRVNYTLRFVDNNGNQLRPDVSGRGNVGDKPVVACQYIEGYRPNALNQTKTLSENEADNVFTFEYTPLDVNVITEFIPGGVVVVGGGGPGAPAAPAGPAGPGGEELPEEPTPLAPPEEMIDLDENRTPLAGLMNDFASSLLGLSLPVKATLIGGVIALGAWIVLAVNKKRKKEDAAEG